jgi:hypothetical protein
MRLSAKELATVEKLADAIGRSRASFIRRLIVRGIEAYELDPRLTITDRWHMEANAAKREQATASLSDPAMADSDS